MRLINGILAGLWTYAVLNNLLPGWLEKTLSILLGMIAMALLITFTELTRKG